jgi:hypothetical protein
MKLLPHRREWGHARGQPVRAAKVRDYFPLGRRSVIIFPLPLYASKVADSCFWVVLIERQIIRTLTRLPPPTTKKNKQHFKLQLSGCLFLNNFNQIQLRLELLSKLLNNHQENTLKNEFVFGESTAK